MNQANFSLPEELICLLKEYKKLTGIPASEVVRRAVKEYLADKMPNNAE